MKKISIKELLNAKAKDCQDIPLLYALLLDRDGDWDGAHKIAQDIKTQAGSHVHAYLHRKEGDIANADYWYSLAREKRPANSIDEEWAELIEKIYSTQN